MNSPTHRITITAAALALLTFTACSSPENSQPDKTSAPASTPATTSAPNTPTATPEPSQTNTPDASSTPPAPATTEPPADKTTFTGTTALGESVTFEILPADAQEFLNGAVSGTGLKGSWGALCSTDASTNQLSGYTIETEEENGQGHSHQWNNIRGEAVKLAPNQLDQTEISNILEYTAGHAKSSGECMTMHTPLSSAGKQGYSTANIGQFFGGKLHDETELH